MKQLSKEELEQLKKQMQNPEFYMLLFAKKVGANQAEIGIHIEGDHLLFINMVKNIMLDNEAFREGILQAVSMFIAEGGVGANIIELPENKAIPIGKIVN